MNQIIFSLLILSISLTSYAQINLPALSPAAEISQKIGLTTVTLSYSRPSLRGRELFGEKGILVAGKKWRTGANATTRLSFSKEVEIHGKMVPKGTYALLTTPHEMAWTFHLYPYETGAYTQFLEREPLIEMRVSAQQLPYSVETFSLHFESITMNEAIFVLQWGNYKVALPIRVNEHEAILANIEKELQGPSDFQYFQAALYLHETQSDLPLALTYIREVTKSESALFFQVYREALILEDLDRKAEALEAAKRARKLSQKAGNADIERLSQRMVEELGVEIGENTDKKYP